MNFSPTCCQKPERQCRTTIYCQRNSIFHGQKNNYNIHLKFDRPKSGFVRAKKYLAGHYDRRPAVCYLEPWRPAPVAGTFFSYSERFRIQLSLKNRRYFFRLFQASAKQARGPDMCHRKVPSPITPVLRSTPALCFIHP